MAEIKINDLEYTGERVVPNKMHNDVINWMLHLQRYVFVLKLVVNKEVLDVACGTGYGMSLLSSVAKNVEGVDIDQKTLEWAKGNNHFYCPVTFKQLDIEKEEITGEFHCIVSFETIEHLDRPEVLLGNAKKVLSQDGIFVFSTPINEPFNLLHKKSYDWVSIGRLIGNNFSRYVKWYSQTKEGIVKGRKREALFAIGVAYKTPLPFLDGIKKRTWTTGHLLKRKLKEYLGVIPKSRW